MSVLAVLLSRSGWPAVTRLSWGVLLLPMGQLGLTAWLLTQPAGPGQASGSAGWLGCTACTS